MQMVLLTLFSSGSKLWLIEIHVITVFWDSANCFRTLSILNSSTKRTTGPFPKWSCSASSQCETVVPAATACSYTAECRWQSTVTGSQQSPDITWLFSSLFHRVGGRVIRSPGILQKNGCPSPHPCSVTARVGWFSGPKAYHLSPILPHVTWPDSNE